MASAAFETRPPAHGRHRSVTIAVPQPGAPVLVGAGVALALVLAAFVATGGLRLEPTTRVLIGLMLAGGALCCAAVLRGPTGLDRPRPLYGGLPLLAFALLAAFTALSVIWSLAPGDSWVEANRTFAYVATFAAGIALARLAPGAWPGLLGGLAAGCLAISAWALLTKVFPGALAPDETYARLRAPFEYWNSVGLMAALGVPPFLWLAARRSGNAIGNALAWPALALLLVCVMVSYSRGALVAVAAGVAVWLVAVPLRRAGLAALGAAILGAGPLVAWAFQQDGLTTDKAPLAARVDAGHELGALLLLVCVVLLGAGLAYQFARSQRPLSAGRRLSGRVALAAVLALAVGLLAAAWAAPGALDEQVADNWTRLTDPDAPTPANTPDRLTATSSVRARYWDEAFKVHQLSPWVGTGAGAYAITRSRYRSDALAVRHAHGYVPQTLADLGWVGLGLSLLALIAWALSAARATGMRLRDRGRPFDPERIGQLSLLTVVVVFGVHSALDWTWFVPANMIPALLAAGWVAARPPLRARLLGDVRDEPPAAARVPLLRRPAAFVRRRSLPALAALLIAVIALAAAWTAFQPVRSVHASDAAFERVGNGAFEPAAAIGRIAVDRNPLSVDARFDLAAIEQARGQLATAEAALEGAVGVEPANAETWRRLGRLRLEALGRPREALRPFQAAYFLDPESPISTSDLLEVNRAIAAGG